MMTPQRMGGIAALTGAATNLLGAVVFAALLSPKGLGSTDSDPGKTVALLADNQGAMRAFYLIIFLAFGGSLIFLSVALHERLKAGSAVLAQAATIFTLIWAVLIIVVGTLSINDLSTVVRLHSENPAQAATVWVTLDSVETGLGAGGGETVVSGLWFLLLSWAALRAGVLPRLLIYLGVVTGVAGILSVLALTGLTYVYALCLIISFVWLGIVMLRGRVRHRSRRSASSSLG
jgi:Domain of unknown function (DUF4386)